MPCPFCSTGRLFVVAIEPRPQFVEYGCFSCGWREYSDEAPSKRLMRLEAHLARKKSKRLRLVRVA